MKLPRTDWRQGSRSVLPERLEKSDRLVQEENRSRSELFREAMRRYVMALNRISPRRKRFRFHAQSLGQHGRQHFPIKPCDTTFVILLWQMAEADEILKVSKRQLDLPTFTMKFQDISAL